MEVLGVEVSDAYATDDPEFVRLRSLLNTVGRDLKNMHQWEFLNKQYQFFTQAGDSGIYDLPDDFDYMINQTHWERSENVPLLGPLSPQDWTYLLGRDLVSQTIYASFREVDNKLYLFPQPPPEGLDINFEYMSRNWVFSSETPGTELSKVAKPADIVKFDSTLAMFYLKLKYCQVKGLDSTTAQTDFNARFVSITGQDTASDIINAARNYRGYPYLDAYRNTPDTRFGFY